MNIKFCTLSLLLVLGQLSPLFGASRAGTVQSIVGDSSHWNATEWNSTETGLFGGMPIYQGKDLHLILVRYSFYVSDYDADMLSPAWVAHFDAANSSQNNRQRKNGVWDRGNDVFRPDANVVSYSQTQRLPFARDVSFKNANPSVLPDGPKYYRKITRGHMASNQEMKSQGDSDEGQKSQDESFSLANVCPQMQHHNSPIWAKLETSCLIWAEKLGGVAVISGPVFAPDSAQPLPVERLLKTEGADGLGIPIPTHFFKIIIGKRKGQLAAIGFLIPHRADLSSGMLAKYVVPIRKIESMTSINFMPALGQNDGLEASTASGWFELLKPNKTTLKGKRTHGTKPHPLL